VEMIETSFTTKKDTKKRKNERNENLLNSK
jgi:hypothetical protein